MGRSSVRKHEHLRPEPHGYTPRDNDRRRGAPLHGCMAQHGETCFALQVKGLSAAEQRFLHAKETKNDPVKRLGQYGAGNEG
jgi:hypothetical protein